MLPVAVCLSENNWHQNQKNTWFLPVFKNFLNFDRKHIVNLLKSYHQTTIIFFNGRILLLFSFVFTIKFVQSARQNLSASNSLKQHEIFECLLTRKF